MGVQFKPVTTEMAFFTCDGCDEKAPPIKSGEGLPPDWMADEAMRPVGTYCKVCSDDHLEREVRRALGTVNPKWEDRADVTVYNGCVEVFIDRA